MTNEQRLSLVAHGLDELPKMTRTVYTHRVDNHMQVDFNSSQNNMIILSKDQAYELATAIIKALVNWEVEG